MSDKGMTPDEAADIIRRYVDLDADEIPTASEIRRALRAALSHLQARRVVVGKGEDCPAFSVDESGVTIWCGLEDRYGCRQDIPAWCPLRAGPITLVLEEE